jgi:hypothetical protein
MKNLLLLAMIFATLIACNTSKNISSSPEDVNLIEQDTVRITSDKVEYEIIIIEPGFNTWLVTVARPEGHYSQEFLEGRNLIFVNEWNRRVLNGANFDPNLYEVNYKLYNYFIYFQRKYKQRLSGFIPRI